MSVRQDKVQIKVEFITDESKQLAKTILDTKTLGNNLSDAQKELEKYRKEVEKAGDDEKKRAAAAEKVAAAERKVEDALKGIAAAGKQAEKIDLSKVAPAQLAERARQLREALKFAPSNTAEAANFRAELQRINTQQAALTQSTKALGPAGTSAFGSLSGGARGLLTALGPIALGLITLQSLFEGLRKLFNIGTDAEALTTKMSAVFGESAKIVEEFSEKNANAIGLSRQEYKALATDVGDLLTPMGFTKKAAAELSIELVNQAGVLSRWTKGKVDTQQATEILNKALLGERDALNSLGIDIKDSLIQSELKRKGLQDLTGEELRQAEALVTLEQITKQSANANASYAKGTEDLTEKKARLRAQISEIASKLGTALVPVFNKVLEVIIPVVDWVIQFGTGLYYAYQRAETFRATISAAFGGIGSVISGVAKGIAGVADGFVSLFSGDFSKAADNFKKGFTELDPFEIGKNMKDGVVDGWNSVKKPKADVETDNTNAQNKGRELASAFGGGYDQMYSDIKKKSKKSAEDIADDAKKAFDAALAEVVAQQKKEEFLLENQRINKRKSEEQYYVDLTTVAEIGLKKRLEVYKKFQKLDTAEAIALQNELDTLTIAREGFREERSVEILQAALDAEKDFNVKKIDSQLVANREQLTFMQEHAAKVTAEDKKNKAELLKNEQELERERQKIRQESFKATADIFGLVADILERDEAAQKKNASVVKAFKKAEITINSIAEISAIYKNAQTSIEGGILGPAGAYGLATVQALVAAGRAALAINNIEKTKLERGRVLSFGRGKSGIFGGQPHSSGGTKGWFSDGTQVEVEKDEAWAVVNKKNTPILKMLSNVNALNGNGDPYFQNGGVMRFNTGGLPNFNTTPSNTAPPAGISFQNSDSSGSMERAAALIYAAAQMMPREVQAKVNYLDIESAGTELASIRNDASI